MEEVTNLKKLIRELETNPKEAGEKSTKLKELYKLRRTLEDSPIYLLSSNEYDITKSEIEIHKITDGVTTIDVETHYSNPRVEATVIHQDGKILKFSAEEKPYSPQIILGFSKQEKKNLKKNKTKKFTTTNIIYLKQLHKVIGHILKEFNYE